MSSVTVFLGHTIIHRLDPRARVLVAAAFTVLMAVCHRFEVLAPGLALALVFVILARLPVGLLARRLRAINLFLLVFFVLIPFSVPGDALFALGRFSYSRQGLERAIAIALRANTIVLCFTALLSTMEPAHLGHALRRLRAPAKVAHLFLFTIRYIDVLHDEYRRLRTAMRVRCFRPAWRIHTYRSMGYLIGMLLVRSLDRSERVLAAMKCRGFRGQFYVLDQFAAARRDVVFAAVSVCAMLALAWLEWMA